MQNNEITLFKKVGLAKASDFNYSKSVNAFIGNGYTSMAGNTYLNEIRLIEGLLVKKDVGSGYAHTFINGLQIFDIRTKQLLCEKSYHCVFYSQSFIKSEIKSMLYDLLNIASKKNEITINKSDVKKHINKLVDNAFTIDQRKMLIEQSKKYLNS